MTTSEASRGHEPRLHVARAKYLTAYVLLSHATAQLDKLAVTRGAYKRTRRSIVRAAAIVMLVGGMLGLAAPRTGHATPVFADPVAGAFGASLWGSESFIAPALADIDGDGDLDMFIGQFIGVVPYKWQRLWFFENTGTASSPAFVDTGDEPFGAEDSYAYGNLGAAYFHGGPNLVDIDDDGDLDLFLQNASSGVDFFENIGTPNAPFFDPAAVPAGFKDDGYGVANGFVDIDGDGDLDAFHGVTNDSSSYIAFQENTGTAAAPSFAAEEVNPFGFDPPNLPSPVFVDTDGDGDFDAFTGAKYGGDMYFQENLGNPLGATFGLISANPFGISLVDDTTRPTPTFGDIDDDGDIDMFVGVRQFADADSLFFYENLEINCGDGILDPSEVCDAAALDGATCVTEGYDGGALACAADCLSFDASACVGQPCSPTPSGTCLAAGKAQFQLKAHADPAKSQLKLKWQKGATFAHADLGNPVATTDTALCIYDETAGVPALVRRISVPANAFWSDKDPKGFRLSDKVGTNGGVTKVQLKPHEAGKSSVSLQAKGPNLTLPTPISGTEYFDQDTDVTVQLVSEAGICWSADFAVAGTSKNDGVQFRAKTP